jgi:uncharacterized membrane protein YkvA (DUF1232 family)
VELVLGLLAALVLAWLVLAAFLLVARPRGRELGDFARLLPDTLRLFRGLLGDPTVPLAAKARVWFLLAYLAMPIDLIPDFIPVLGYADDAIVAAIVLRSVLRRAGRAKISEHWPGTADSLAALLRAANAQ